MVIPVMRNMETNLLHCVASPTRAAIMDLSGRVVACSAILARLVTGGTEFFHFATGQWLTACERPTSRRSAVRPRAGQL